MPVCWIIAGPNGAGKTTFALEYLPQVAGCRNFINADLIAAGLSPLDPERELVTASRLLLKELRGHIKKREDFSFETTLSGRGYLRLIKQLKKEKWRVELVYLALPSVEMSSARVGERVAHGGHNIPEKDINRRFPRSLHNLLQEYGVLVDRARCFMNTSDVPELIFEQYGRERTIIHESYYRVLLEEAEK
jgi:predicted ABC-type ATPase